MDLQPFHCPNSLCSSVTYIIELGDNGTAKIRCSLRHEFTELVAALTPITNLYWPVASS